MLDFESLGGALGGLLGEKGRRYGRQAGGLADWMAGAPDPNNPTDPSLFRIPFLNVGIAGRGAVQAHNTAQSQRHLFDHQTAVAAAQQAANLEEWSKNYDATRKELGNVPFTSPTAADRAVLRGTYMKNPHAAPGGISGGLGAIFSDPSSGSSSAPYTSMASVGSSLTSLANTTAQPEGVAPGTLMRNIDTGEPEFPQFSPQQQEAWNYLTQLKKQLPTQTTQQATYTINGGLNLPPTQTPQGTPGRDGLATLTDTGATGEIPPAPAAEPPPSRLPFTNYKSPPVPAQTPATEAAAAKKIDTVWHKEPDGTSMPAGLKLLEILETQMSETEKRQALEAFKQMHAADWENVLSQAQLFSDRREPVR